VERCTSWQSDKMAPRPDLVLQNILKNATDGTYGLVAVLNATLKAESLKEASNDEGGIHSSNSGAGVIKDLETTLGPLPSLLNDSFSGIENDELLLGSASNGSFLDCTNHLQSDNITHHHLHKATNFSEIPVKEIIIVLGMLGLWFYSIVLTRKAWYRILKE